MYKPNKSKFSLKREWGGSHWSELENLPSKIEFRRDVCVPT